MDQELNVDRSHQSEQESARREALFHLLKEAPIPDDELLSNLGLFISKTEFSRMLYLHELYRKILDVHGVVMEFGVRWGQNLALFETFRGMYEPFNRNRTILGFDTFAGFPSVSPVDGTATAVSVGGYSVPEGYEDYLAKVLDCHEEEGPALTEKGYELHKGDASTEITEYLDRHPETIIALAYFDLDIYEPTKYCLQAIRSHITKGTIVAFDELNTPLFPGETVALKEVFGLEGLRLVHTPYSSSRAYFVVS